MSSVEKQQISLQTETQLSSVQLSTDCLLPGAGRSQGAGHAELHITASLEYVVVGAGGGAPGQDRDGLRENKSTRKEVVPE